MKPHHHSALRTSPLSAFRLQVFRLSGFSLGAALAVCTLSAQTAQPSLEVFPHDGAPGEIATFKQGERIFTNRDYRFEKPPAVLDGNSFLRVPIDGMEIRCTAPGELFVLTPSAGSASIAQALLARGFAKETRFSDFHPWGGNNRLGYVSLYRKTLKAGETLKLGKWCIVFGFARADFKPTANIPEFSTNHTEEQNAKARAAADKALGRLIKVTGASVKGAHAVEMELVGNHAYIVYMANDIKPGESSRMHEMYAAMSIVNLDTLRVEEIIPFARSGQSFENEKLLPGAIYGVNILQKDAQTLRCWFTSADPDVRQAPVYYIDFDMPSRTFSKTIHHMKMKTSRRVFPMQPHYFYADAWDHGLRKKPSDTFLFLWDSFKKIDGRIYANINMHNNGHAALGLMNDSLDTVEILGHYFEPQELSLSEVATNRLPDGTWMAIIRQETGNLNYAFAFSANGKKWEPAQFMDFVPNGTNSKPIFERFNGAYYLGWQEATKDNRVWHTRNIFNLDVSTDGKTWERKYRFETEKTFQYPAFRSHNGRVWLAVTQGDPSVPGSIKQRIMFGLLE